MERHYPKVSIHIVAWNSMRFLPELLASIEKQTYRDFNVLMIDNGSNDGTETFVRANYPRVAYLRNAKNLGFSFAHNQGIRYALDRWEPSTYATRYVLVTNPDIILTETFLEQLVHCVDLDQTIGSAGGTLLRAFGENLRDETLSEIVRSDLIDSTALRPQKNGTCSDRGAGEMDVGQYDLETNVFGVSGALVLFRASALQDARFQDEFFDQDFFAYKEDVDLAWRLQHLGWNARFVPDAVAYHYRGMYGKERMGLWERFKNRRNKSLSLSYYSTRNQWLLLWKNLSFLSAILWFPRIFVSEMLRILYTFFFEMRNVRAFFDAIRLLPRIWKKRRQLMKHRKRKGKELRTLFV